MGLLHIGQTLRISNHFSRHLQVTMKDFFKNTVATAKLGFCSLLENWHHSARLLLVVCLGVKSVSNSKSDTSMSLELMHVIGVYSSNI